MIKVNTQVKILVSLVLIGILFFLFGSGEITRIFEKISLNDLFLITFFCTLSLAILAKRFQRVLSSRGVTESWLSVYLLQLMGLTMNQFMPGVYGGDLLRALYFMPEHREEKRFLTASVVFERLCGFLALMMIGVVSSFTVGVADNRPIWLMIGTLLVVALGLSLIVMKYLASSLVRKQFVFKWFQVSRDVVDGLFSLFGKRRLFISTVVLSCLSQAFSILTFWYLMDALGVEISLPAIAAVVALGWLVTLLPVSLNGLGLRESGLVVGFISFGVAKSVALSISLIALLPTFIHAFIGAVIIAFNLSRIAGLKRLLSG